MFYKVNVHYEGGWPFEIEANSEEEAKEKAMEAFSNLSPDELVDNFADSFVDFYQVFKAITLSPDEYNALNKIASATKMDCWFSIKETDCGDVIYDLENDKNLSLFTGVGQLFEGMVEPVDAAFYKLNKNEIIAFKELLKKLNIVEKG